VLFRGGLRDAEVLLAEFDAVGDGVDDILIAASSCDRSDMLTDTPAVICVRADLPNVSTSNYLAGLFVFAVKCRYGDRVSLLLFAEA